MTVSAKKLYEIVRELPEEPIGPSEPHAGIDTGWDIDAALRRLSPERRASLLLREIEGLTYQEIATALGWPVGTVATELHRARLELRAALSAGVGKEQKDAVQDQR